MAAADAEMSAAGGHDGDVLGAADNQLGDTLGPGFDFGDGATEQAAARLADDVGARQEDEVAEITSLEAPTMKLPLDCLTRRRTSSGHESLKESLRLVRAGEAGARENWKNITETVKPDHLKVPSDVYHIVDRLIQPHRPDPRDAIPEPVRNSTGLLAPKASVDPTVVRSFVHRIDSNNDDLLEPFELAEISLSRKLDISDKVIMTMFSRIIESRPPGLRNSAGVSWAEIYKEMTVEKRWMKTLDINVMSDDGENYIVAVEQSTLEKWCRVIQAKFSSDYPGLEAPRSLSASEMQKFFSRLLSLKNAKTGKLLQSEVAVQKLLKMPEDKASTLASKPRFFAAASVDGERQAWAWEEQPNRQLWLRFFRAVGLKPLLANDIESGKMVKKADEATKEAGYFMKSANIANTSKAANASKVTKEGQVKVRQPKQSVMVREGIREGQENEGPTNSQLQADSEAPQPWEDKRLHNESLVNGAVANMAMANKFNGAGYPAVAASGADDTSARTVDEPTCFSFDSQRRFQQVHAKHGRDSENQRSIGKDKQDLKRQNSLLGQAGQSVAHQGIKFRGPHQHMGFCHHHLTNSVEPSRLKYEKDLGHTWDGTHIDHSRMTPWVEDAKISKMSPEERAKQFKKYYPKPDNQCIRVNGLEGVKDIVDDYKPWQNHEFRHDGPTRHGKFGRRVFDAQVKLSQPGTLVSGIETKPIEEDIRRQDLITEFLDRSLPAQQEKHFEHYFSKSEMPYRKEVDTFGRTMTGVNNYI